MVVGGGGGCWASERMQRSTEHDKINITTTKLNFLINTTTTATTVCDQVTCRSHTDSTNCSETPTKVYATSRSILPNATAWKTRKQYR